MELAPLVGVNLPVDDAGKLTEALRSTLEQLPCGEELKMGASAEVVLPGMSSATGVFLTLWHGMFGSFPKVRWAVRGSNGFEWPEHTRVDLQEVRLQARTNR